MKINYKWKKILSTVLAVVLLVGAVGAVAAVASNDSKPAGAVFKIGGLDPVTGKYVDTDKSIYTEEAFDCYGLRVEPDFESTVTYDIYYYDGKDKLLAVVEDQTEVYDEDFEIAEKCRIVIHPEIPEDTNEKDFKVYFWEVMKYANMLDITVSKNSSKVEYSNIYDEEIMLEGFTIVSDASVIETPTNYIEKSTSKVSTPIEVDSEEEKIEVWIRHDLPPQYITYIIFFDEEGKYISCYSESIEKFNNNGWSKITFDVPENAEDLVFVLPIDAECYAFYR